MPKRRAGRKKLSAEYVRSILDYDPKTGHLHWRPRNTFSIGWNTRWVGAVAGFLVKGHLQIQIDGANYYAHRLAWLHFYGTWPLEQIDHINRDRRDNRINNLRLANHAENCRNKGMQRNNTSGYTGVSFEHQRGLWRARITRDKKALFDAFFETAEEASVAREAALESVHGRFARKGRRKH